MHTDQHGWTARLSGGGCTSVRVLVWVLLCAGPPVWGQTPATPEARPAAIRWESDFATALAKATAEKKPIMVDFYTDWCGWCKVLDQKTYSHPRVIAAAQQIVSVKVDAEKATELAAKYKVQSYPHIEFLSPEGEHRHAIRGYLPPYPFLAQLRAVLAGRDPDKELETLRASNPEDYESLSMLAFALVETRDNAGAIPFCERALAKAPADATAEREELTVLLASLYGVQGHLDKGTALLEQHLKEQPVDNPVQVRANLGHLYQQAGDLAKAREQYEAARKVAQQPETVKQLDQMIRLLGTER